MTRPQCVKDAALRAPAIMPRKSVQKPKKWLNERRTYIGATDIAAIMGVHPYATPLTVYEQKLGLADPVEETEAMYWGNRLEPLIAREYERRSGVKLTKSKFYRHHTAQFFGANPDYEVKGDPSRLVECKTAGYFSGQNWGADGSDEVPDAYVMQTMWQLFITRKQVCDIAVLIGGQDFRVYRVTRDEDLIKMMAHQAQIFWREHVLQKIPPEPTGHKPDTEAVKNRFKEDYGEIVAATEQIDDLCIELGTAREEYSAAELRKAELENRIKFFMGNASVLTSTVGEFRWQKNAKGVRVFKTPFTNKGAA